MKEQFLNFAKGLFYEDGTPSLTRVLAMLYFILFAAVSIYLVVCPIQWNYYEIFASIAGGGGVATQVGNKFINSKYNSASGSYQQTDNRR